MMERALSGKLAFKSLVSYVHTVKEMFIDEPVS